MKSLIASIFFIVGFQLSSWGQVENYSKLIKTLEEVKLPFKVDSFTAFDDKKSNQLSLYNSIVTPFAGYIDIQGDTTPCTGTYSKDTIERVHKYRKNGEVKQYKSKATNTVNFISLVNLSPKYTCILAKVDLASNKIMQTSYYKLLSLDKNGQHLSTINVFIRANDQITYDYKKIPSPKVTSIFKKNKTIDITTDEGYETIFIQHVKLNKDGFFEVMNLEEKQVRGDK